MIQIRGQSRPVEVDPDLLEIQETDDLIINATGADDPSIPADQDPRRQPPPPRYPNLDKEHPPPAEEEPMEVDNVAANESDSSSQDSDSRAAREEAASAAEAREEAAHFDMFRRQYSRQTEGV